MSEKEKNFVSAVMYMGEKETHAYAFLKQLTGVLAAKFESYELIFVDDCSKDKTENIVRVFLDEMEEKPSVTMVHMSLYQGIEAAMNAGIDMANGDFVYEFDSMQLCCEPQFIEKAYEACLDGNDIVAVCPKVNRSFTSGLFYKMFNSASRSKYKLRTEAFRLVSRRAINRVHAVSPNLVYRKAAFAASGLRLKTIEFSGKECANREKMRSSHAMDALVLYTNIAFKTSLIIACLMLALMLASLIYILVVFFAFVTPVPGWTTTMLLLTGAFFGVFLLLTLVLKYLSLLIEIVFKKQNYLIESVEKLG